MKIKNIFGLTLLFVAALCMQSCHDSEDVAATGLTVTKDGSAIESLDFSIGGSYVMLGVNTDADWTASIPEADSTWLSITPHAGYGWAINDTASSNTRSYFKVTVAKNKSDARTSTITVNAGNLSKVINVSQKGTGTDPNDPFESAFTMVENMKLGYNLGNTLDANQDTALSWFNPTTTADWETCWGQPVTTQAMITEIVSKGFNVIRVPVTWFPHLDANNNIDAAWMARVKEVVDYVISTGSYCILNMQHDTGAKDATRKDEQGWLYADADDYATVSPRMQYIWKQIATEFKDYDDKLIFEAFNEILNKQKSWSATPSSSDLATVNKLEQDFVNTVRTTGGKNEYRNLLVNPFGASNDQTQLDGFNAPTDTHPNHIAASVHSYNPYNFCCDNGTYNVYVFDTSCETEIDNIFTRVNARFSNTLGLPYFFGEFGAIDEAKDMAERVKYAKYMATKLTAYQTSGLWWMGLYKRATNTWYESELVNALMNNYKK
jgi:endoglucanase